MTISHLLESFEGAERDEGRSISMSELTLEEEKLGAFERGYKAGWDDAANAQADDKTRVTGDFEQTLQELSFTYHEAYGQLARALKPVLGQIVETVLPAIARKSLAPQIVDELSRLAATAGKQDVEIVVSPVNAGLMRTLLSRDPGFPVKLVEEPSMGEGQAFLRLGESEKQIDYDEVLSGIELAVDAFFHEVDQMIEKETGHGG